jgi:hypothetical protein
VARDKRTARAVARRRYRDQLRAEEAAAAAEANATDETAVTAQPDAGTSRPAGGGAFSSLLRLPDIREDLRAFPGIARGTYAVIVPLGAAAAGFVAGLDPNVYRLDAPAGDSWTLLIARGLFQFVLLPPPVTPVFLAGVLAPRASWLTGGLAGVFSTIFFIALVAIHEPAKMSPALAIDLAVLYVPLYVLLGGFAGYYRKWLLGRRQKAQLDAEERRKTRGRDARRSRTATARR